MVTAETATVLPFLVAITLALAWMISLGISQVRCLDAAREAVRVVARGDGTAAAVAVASRVAPSGAEVSVREGHGLVDVSVTVRVVPPVPLLGDALAVRLVASATAAAEATGATW
jgi:hypothetical protein